MLGHVWNRWPPNFTERTFGETSRGKVRKAEADVRPPVADGEAYRGKDVSRHASQTSWVGVSVGLGASMASTPTACARPTW